MKFADALAWARGKDRRELTDGRRRMRWDERFELFEVQVGDEWHPLNVTSRVLDADWQIVPEKQEPKPAPEGIFDSYQRFRVELGSPDPPSISDIWHQSLKEALEATKWTITPSALGAKDMPAGEEKPKPGSVRVDFGVTVDHWSRVHERLADAEKVMEEFANDGPRLDDHSFRIRFWMAFDKYHAKWPKGTQ